MVMARTGLRGQRVETSSLGVLLLGNLRLMGYGGGSCQSVVGDRAEQNIFIKVYQRHCFAPCRNLQTGLDCRFGNVSLLEVKTISAHGRKLARPVASQSHSCKFAGFSTVARIEFFIGGK